MSELLPIQSNQKQYSTPHWGPCCCEGHCLVILASKGQSAFHIKENTSVISVNPTLPAILSLDKLAVDIGIKVLHNDLIMIGALCYIGDMAVDNMHDCKPARDTCLLMTRKFTGVSDIFFNSTVSIITETCWLALCKVSNMCLMAPWWVTSMCTLPLWRVFFAQPLNEVSKASWCWASSSSNPVNESLHLQISGSTFSSQAVLWKHMTQGALVKNIKFLLE